MIDLKAPHNDEDEVVRRVILFLQGDRHTTLSRTSMEIFPKEIPLKEKIFLVGGLCLVVFANVGVLVALFRI